LINGARQRAERERERADRNFRKARQAVDDYFTAVSQNKLLGEPGMEPLRKELLDKAQKYYDDFAQEEAGDPSVRGELASASYRAVRIPDLIGNSEVAWTKYGAAAAQFEAVLAADPDNAEWRHSLGLCYNHWGLSHEEHGSFEEARRHFQKAQPILEQLNDE